MPGVEERVMGSRLQSSGCTISTTVATLILWPISSQLPDDKSWEEFWLHGQIAKVQVKIEFKDTDVPHDLPKDISLCLFRVAQEALHNAVKYSGVGESAVTLTATADEVHLLVSDTGAGFDVAEAKKNRGLGLVSMHERVQLVHGSLNIESTPGSGTTILATVPIAADHQGSPEEAAVEEATSTKKRPC